MKTSTITSGDLASSVIAVPPLCRNSELKIDAAENSRLIKHLEAGGVSTLLYGGNANLYNIAVSEYDELLQMLAENAGEETLVVPSVGPYFGTAMDQARILKDHEFPAAMMLPATFPASPLGVRRAVCEFVECAGIPVVLYIKDENYVTPEIAAELVDEGIVSWIKYAVVREDPAVDDYLTKLTDLVDRAMIVSGIGEQPAIVHLEKFGVVGFTSGCVCVAPALSMEMLRAIKAGSLEEEAEAVRTKFFALEDLRNTFGPIPVLHHAVSLAGLAETGPHLPLLDSLPAEVLAEIKAAAEELLRNDLGSEA